jgi:alkyl hydroperoxide reductase subunit AhpC
VDPPEKSRELATQLKIRFPLLSDRDHKVIEQYDIIDPGGKFSIASVFVVDKKGIVRWSYVTDDYKVRPLDDIIFVELSKIR